MPAYDSLTPRGRLGRLRALAWSASQRYPLEPARLTLAKESFNTVFRLRSREGGDYALRVGASERIHPAGCEGVEAAWMTALAQESDVPVAHVCRNRDQQVVTVANAPGVPGPRTCVLFGWVPGRTLTGRVDPGAAEQSGRLLAQLHAHACRWSYAPGAAVPVADRVQYWDVPNLWRTVGAPHASILVDAAQRAQVAIDALWAAPPHEPHLLHGDLTPYNLVKTRRALLPIDFQDLIWGFDIQDVVYSLLPYQVLEGGEILTAMFQRGYESVRPWPEADEETLGGLAAARRLHMLNLALNRRWPGRDGYVEAVATRLAPWLARGTPSKARLSAGGGGDADPGRGARQVVEGVDEQA